MSAKLELNCIQRERSGTSPTMIIDNFKLFFPLQNLIMCSCLGDVLLIVSSSHIGMDEIPKKILPHPY